MNKIINKIGNGNKELTSMGMFLTAILYVTFMTLPETYQEIKVVIIIGMFGTSWMTIRYFPIKEIYAKLTKSKDAKSHE